MTTTLLKVADDQTLLALFADYAHIRQQHETHDIIDDDMIDAAAEKICALFIQSKIEEFIKTGDNLNKIFHDFDNLEREVDNNSYFGFGSDWVYLKKIIEFFTTIQIGAIAYDIPKSKRDKYPELLEIDVGEEETYLLSLKELDEDKKIGASLGRRSSIKSKNIILFDKSYAIYKLSSENLNNITPETFERAFNVIKPPSDYRCTRVTNSFKHFDKYLSDGFVEYNPFIEFAVIDYKIITAAARLMSGKIRELRNKLYDARKSTTEYEAELKEIEEGWNECYD